MQKLNDMNLKGLLRTPQTPFIAPRVPIPENPAVDRAIPQGARPLSLAQAESISQTAAPPGRALSGLPPFTTRLPGVRAAQRDGRTLITEAQARRDDLPPGNYIYEDRRGEVHRIDIGEVACNRGKLAKRYKTPLKDLMKTSDAVTCREFGQNGGKAEIR
jgi:hypothetical protein